MESSILPSFILTFLVLNSDKRLAGKESLDHSTNGDQGQQDKKREVKTELLEHVEVSRCQLKVFCTLRLGNIFHEPKQEQISCKFL